MLRKSLLSLFLGGLILSVSFGSTYAEKVVKIDPKANTITISVENKDTTFKLDEKPQFLTQVKAGKRLNVVPFKEGLKGIKPKDDVVVTTELKDGAEVVTKIVVSPASLPAKKKVEPKKPADKKE